MAIPVGLVLIFLAVVVAVVQVHWVARSARLPASWWRVSRPLPTGRRYASDLGIAALVLAGAFAVEQGRPEWTFYAAAVGGGVLVAAAQAVTVGLLRDRARAGTAAGH
ncbi:hypothetical protein [Blastococcus sp. LR1]|uniref:hypothetical protein n=1 Tax=Blastococcus sp. LR1 TaxID=2877000 RepID=UPI001CC99996|nr:hypothetical protein [Blastococcus sp. LR1]MCA0143597.1 hypothetical protein [Blastococcus sp. LR1]